MLVLNKTKLSLKTFLTLKNYLNIKNAVITHERFIINALCSLKLYDKILFL